MKRPDRAEQQIGFGFPIKTAASAGFSPVFEPTLPPRAVL